jgi:thioredoxin-related protein
MRSAAFRSFALFPLVISTMLLFAGFAPAADPVMWRSDYNSARKEALEKGLPLFLVIGTENCFYCRKLEAGPLHDQAVASQLGHNFIPLKVDANKESSLARALKVQVYPTMVLAAPDGKIVAFIEGYLESDRILEQLNRAVTTTTTTDWSARDFEQAAKALAVGEYPRAVSLLKGIVREASTKPIGIKAKQILADVEKLAADRLARAKALEQRGFTQEAVDTLAEAMKSYAGTQAASDAAALMTGLAATPEMRDRLRMRAARDLLAAGREEFRAARYYDCLQKCEQLVSAYPDLPEGNEAKSLAEDVRTNPERLAIACEQMNQRTATMYLALADAWVKKGQGAEAISCYEKVASLSPKSQLAQIATAEMNKLRANGAPSPAGLQKP